MEAKLEEGVARQAVALVMIQSAGGGGEGGARGEQRHADVP